MVGDSYDDKDFASFDDMKAEPVEDRKMLLKLVMQQKAAKEYKRAFGDKITFDQLERDVVDKHFFAPKNNNGKKKFYFDYLNSLKDEGIPLDPKQESFHEQYSIEKEGRDRVYDAQIAKERNPKKKLQIAVAKEYAQYSDTKGIGWSFADLEKEVVKGRSEDKGIKNIRLKRAIYDAYLDKLKAMKMTYTEKERSVQLSHIAKSIFSDHVAQVSVSGALSPPPPKVASQPQKREGGKDRS